MKPNFPPLNQASSQVMLDIFDGQVDGQFDAPFEGEEPRAALAPRFAQWLATSKPFVAFAQQNQLKIRKKIRTLHNDAEREDLACELHTAYLLLQEPKFTLEYEPLVYEPGGKTRARSADFAVTFRTHTRFHVEVTRLRVPLRAAASGEGDRAAESVSHQEGQRLAYVVGEKLGQLSAVTPNVLWIWGTTGEGSRLAVDFAMDEVLAALKRRANRATRTFFNAMALPSAQTSSANYNG